MHQIRKGRKNRKGGRLGAKGHKGAPQALQHVKKGNQGNLRKPQDATAAHEAVRLREGFQAVVGTVQSVR